MRKTFIVIVFMFLTSRKGMEGLSIIVVTMGYTRLFNDLIRAIPRYKEIYANIPGPEIVKDKIPWLIAGYTVDALALFIIFLIY